MCLIRTQDALLLLRHSFAIPKVTVLDTKNLHFSTEFRGAPSQVAAAAWKAADIPWGMCGCSTPADYVNTYVRKENGVALPIFWAGWYWYIRPSFAVLCILANFQSRLEHTVTALTSLGFVSGRQHYCTYVHK